MILADLANGDSFFIDANILVYHFTPHPQFGPACNHLVRRIQNHEVMSFTSTHIVTELAHRLMTLEAATLAGWSPAQSDATAPATANGDPKPQPFPRGC
jgi:predicted nucleic acid-binding protein